MQTVLLILHNLIRWGVLLFGLWALFSALTGVISKRSYTPNDKRGGLLFMTFCDIQLLIGLVLYFKGPWFDMLKNNFHETMKNPYNRFYALEHMAMMIIAWLLVHIGYAAVKKAGSERSKHLRGLIFFGLALIIILVSIPWPFRTDIGRPWFHSFN